MKDKFADWHKRLSLSSAVLATALARGRRQKGDLEYISRQLTEALKEINEQIHEEQGTVGGVPKAPPVHGGGKRVRKTARRAR